MRPRLMPALLRAISFLLLSAVAAASQCVDVSSVPGDVAPEVAAKNAEYAIAAISNPEYQAKDPGCVVANMSYLGLAHVSRATPALIALLGYKVSPRPLRKPLLSDIYPAIAALGNMGESATPALIEVLATKDNDSVESRNALDAFMDLNGQQQNLDIALRKLKQAAKEEKDPARAAHLIRAVQDARARWCRFSVCTE